MRLARASLWCAHPRLKPGESFSSWLHRCAFANGLSNHTYCRYVFGDRPVWNRDVDHLVDGRMLEAAAAATLEDATRLKKGTLAAFSGILFDGTQRGGHFPWVLSLGVYHRTRRRHGQQFCPACLRDGVPWLRLEWRLAWTVCCPLHGCYLRDACPACDAPFVFHRVSLALPGQLACHLCGANVLRDAAGILAPRSAVRFQKRLARGLSRGAVAIRRDRYAPSLEFFSGLRVLARGVFNRRYWSGMESALPPSARGRAPLRPPMNIEHWRVRERIFAMDVLRRALCDWPERFVADCRRTGVYRARFDGAPCLASWLNEGLDGLRRLPPPGGGGRVKEGRSCS